MYIIIDSIIDEVYHQKLLDELEGKFLTVPDIRVVDRNSIDFNRLQFLDELRCIDFRMKIDAAPQIAEIDNAKHRVDLQNDWRGSGKRKKKFTK